MDLLTTPEIQRRYAQMVLREFGEYLRLTSPEDYAYWAKIADG